MNESKKIGLIFLLAGVLMIPLFYLIASREGFVLMAIVGLMAMAFGGFQLFLANTTVATVKARKGQKRIRG